MYDCKPFLRGGLAAIVLSFAAQAQAQLVTPTAMTFYSEARSQLDGGSEGRKSRQFTLTGAAFDVAVPSPILLSELMVDDLLRFQGIIGMQTNTYLNGNVVDQAGTFRFGHFAIASCSEECSESEPVGGILQYIDKWSYSFTALANASFKFDYDLRQAGFTPGDASGFEYREANGILSFGPSGCIACSGAINGSGSFSYALTAGQSYTFDLWSYSKRQFESAVVTGGYGNDLFSYNITALSGGVPEPATWAMMIIGFGLVGAGMRRRRAQLVAA